MKKLILFSALLVAIYLVVRQSLVGPSASPPEQGLESLTTDEKIRALDELKVLYPKKVIEAKATVKTRRVEKPFFQGEKEDFERLEKVQYLDERGNPVNLNEEGEP